MLVSFAEATSKRDIATLARLAQVIWRDHYTPIIGAGQVAYMLDKFQSAAAIAAHIAGPGNWYFLIRHQRRAVGYIGLERRGETLFLSKLYLEKSVRGQGLGRCAVDFVRRFAAERGFSSLSLTVNKHNAVAIAAYQRTGFTRTGEVVTDIGGGYVMDDYVFELRL